ncbi:amidase [Indioceanicola profundi]|uniref:amidase n=1 Tax=Indioceanicola profundi TaxID=2220096 RepID=UPI000E6A958D|nr:amidase [Indioceanicola profundi]
MSLGQAYGQHDATGLAELVARREVSPAELVDSAIARIEAVEPALDGIVERAFDCARKAAKEPLPDGPFAGVPFLLKDNMNVAAGIPYHNGSAIWRGWTPDRDSELVARFRRAGLILLGSTKVPELSLMPVTEPKTFGPAHNPWDGSRTPGGSSGGSAAHVAARSVPMAHATDGGGSIRIPASCCGLFGLKPSRGRTPNGPYIGEGWHGASIAHAVTRSVRDSARLLDAVAGPDAGAPYGIAPPETSFAAALDRPPGRLRIAVSSKPPVDVPVHPDCMRALDQAARLCAELGHEVEEATPDLHPDFLKWFMTVFFAAVAQEFAMAEAQTGTKARRQEVETATWLARLLGRSFSAEDLSLAIERLHRQSRLIAPFFERYDVLLTPTLAQPPLSRGALKPAGAEAFAQEMAAVLGMGGLAKLGPFLDQAVIRAFGFIPYTPVWNVTGQPAASIPLHWAAPTPAAPAGLPIGVQAVGRFGEETTLISLAAQLEQACPWADRHPPL